uniref:Cytochrome P450, family 2, subfamily N, polypeptide 13 n=1 Tax=Sinocyclocheilus anshuiensis TaxID=1608454 RepID=A0A671PFV0_9TELE
MVLTSNLEILDFKGLLLFVVAFLLVADYVKNRNPPNYPLCPFSLPLLGNVFNIDSKEPHIYLTKLGHAYNNIFSLRLGRDKVVFITGYKLVKEALVTQAENVVDRPYIFVTVPNSGLFFSNGEMWKKQRRFAMSTLRNFGLGKKTMELAICEESRFLLDEIDKQKGTQYFVFDPTILFKKAVSNIICQMVFGQRFDYANHQFRTMLKYISKSIQLEGSIRGQHLPGPHNDMFSNYKLLNTATYFTSSIPDQKPHETTDGFDEENIVPCVLDLFLAGTETTCTALCWGLIYLITYPEVQENVQGEIDRVIGRSKEPSIAVIHEILRFGEIVPMNGLQVADKDTTLGECFIPKVILPILHSVLFDENEWETPYKFNPGHFLDKEGQFVRRDAFMPFSAGKRVCLGEQLARMELFLFFVSLFRKFRFSAAEGEKLNLDGVIGVTRTPGPFKIHAMAR